MINNIELHKLLYSDPYQYSDELKRIKNFLSPRQSLLSKSAEMAAAMNRVWNEGYSDAKDKDGNWVFLAETAWILNTAIQQNPKIEFHTTSEFKI